MTPLLVALAVILLDQASKEWVRGAFGLHESIPVIPGFFSAFFFGSSMVRISSSVCRTLSP